MVNGAGREYTRNRRKAKSRRPCISTVYIIYILHAYIYTHNIKRRKAHGNNSKRITRDMTKRTEEEGEEEEKEEE